MRCVRRSARVRRSPPRPRNAAALLRRLLTGEDRDALLAALWDASERLPADRRPRLIPALRRTLASCTGDAVDRAAELDGDGSVGAAAAGGPTATPSSAAAPAAAPASSRWNPFRRRQQSTASAGTSDAADAGQTGIDQLRAARPQMARELVAGACSSRSPGPAV